MASGKVFFFLSWKWRGGGEIVVLKLALARFYIVPKVNTRGKTVVTEVPIADGGVVHFLECCRD